MKRKHIFLLAIPYILCYGIIFIIICARCIIWDIKHVQRSNERISSFMRWRLDHGWYLSSPEVVREWSHSVEISKRRGAYLQSYRSLPFSFSDGIIKLQIPPLEAFLEYQQDPDEKGESLINLSEYYEFIITPTSKIKEFKWDTVPQMHLAYYDDFNIIVIGRFARESEHSAQITHTKLQFNPEDTLHIPITTSFEYSKELTGDEHCKIPLGELLFVPINEQQ